MKRRSNLERCDECGDELHIGDWPMCRGKGSHSSVLSVNAQRFTPVTYFQHIKTGEKIIPPGNDVQPPSGYVAKTANNFSEVRRLTKDLDFQSKENYYRYHAQRQQTKKLNITDKLEHAQRAREKMSDPLAMKITDVAIERLKDQMNRPVPDFKPSGHFAFMENDGGRVN